MLGVPALAVVAAATDALSYLGLGKVFPANMTGNTVLLGIGIAEGDWGAALHSVCALGGLCWRPSWWAACRFRVGVPGRCDPRWRLSFYFSVDLRRGGCCWALTRRPDRATG